MVRRMRMSYMGNQLAFSTGIQELSFDEIGLVDGGASRTAKVATGVAAVAGAVSGVAWAVAEIGAVSGAAPVAAGAAAVAGVAALVAWAAS
jgi:hypothetical protein